MYEESSREAGTGLEKVPAAIAGAVDPGVHELPQRRRRCGASRRRAPTVRPSAEELPAVMGVTDAAGFLGVNSKSVYEAIARGELPGARRIGRAIRIHRDTLLEWLSGEEKHKDQGRVPRRQSS